jgi:hypothetical protein
MPRALCLTMTILAFPGGTAVAAAPADLGANAALKYWQAFATLPRFSSDEQKKLNAESTTMPLDAHARAMVSKAEYSFKMMYLGAALPRCDWAIGFEEGIGQLLPQNDGTLVLSGLACLRARIRFEEGRDAEAVADLLAAMTLARHISQDNGYLVSTLVGYRIEERTSQTLATHLPNLNSRMLKDLKARLDGLPPGGNVAVTLRNEEKCSLDWLVRLVKDVDRRIKSGEVKEKVLASVHEDLKQIIEKCGSPADFFKFAEEMRPWYAHMAGKWDVPLDQFDKEWERDQAKYADNPVFKTYVPAIVKVRRSQARADVRRALLAAAIDIELGGRAGLQDALKSHPDPVVGGPFEYEEFPGWFELRSKWKLGSRPQFNRDDAPLELTVGRRQK